ncbi:translation initiation factor IF-2 subunit gamma [archaeon]|nr:translation initiation factor IF-2 subunit gamma [archaeon]
MQKKTEQNKEQSDKEKEITENKESSKELAADIKENKIAEESTKDEKDDAERGEQPVINIGLIGHVDHGKTTLTERLTGKWTDTHSEEIKRGITIKLGYANAVFFKCKNCEGDLAYSSSGMNAKQGKDSKCRICGSELEKLRIVSFVDAPGHETLMATMLSGSAIIDCALLLVAANEPCPQPQTKEHLLALDIANIHNIIIVQNKIDIVSEEGCIKNYKEIREFLKGTFAENAPIIPISAQQSINIDTLIRAIQENFKTPKRDLNKDLLMFIARSFDLNKPGADAAEIIGGVVGGAIKEGFLCEGDTIEIKPGIKMEKEGRIFWEPLVTEAVSIRTEASPLKKALPGGSIAILTKLDPGLVKSDSLTGNIIGRKGGLPETLYALELEPHLLQRVVGAKEELNVEPIKKGEPLMINVNSTTTAGVVSSLSKGSFHLKLKIPVCARKNDKFTISRLVGGRYRLIGYGMLKQ